MEIETFYLGCLSHASYLVHDTSSGVAAVIDPQRDVGLYLNACRAKGTKIQHVLLTHFHADFVAGHLELRARGAQIYLGARARAEFSFHALSDGEELCFGETRLVALETPGHTPEGISIVCYDSSAFDPSKPVAVFTGDTLFLGDVGRPDLMASVGMSAEELASLLFDSLHQKLLKLPDDTLVYPAHGAGSMCGKQLSDERVSTLGKQRLYNPALQLRTKEEFVAEVTAGLPKVPQYFGYDAKLNRSNRETLEKSLEKGLHPLGLEEFLVAQRTGAVVIDSRGPEAFAKGHLVESLGIGLGGSFATWVGTLVPPDTELLILAERGREEETALRLGRIGYDQVRGFLEGGFAALSGRPELLRSHERVTPDALRAELASANAPVLIDVRTPREFAEMPIQNARNMSLSELESRLGELPFTDLVLFCQTGYRSSVSIGLLERHGYLRTREIDGGYEAWSGQPSSAESCTLGDGS